MTTNTTVLIAQAGKAICEMNGLKMKTSPDIMKSPFVHSIVFLGFEEPEIAANPRINIPEPQIHGNKLVAPFANMETTPALVTSPELYSEADAAHRLPDVINIVNVAANASLQNTRRVLYVESAFFINFSVRMKVPVCIIENESPPIKR